MKKLSSYIFYLLLLLTYSCQTGDDIQLDENYSDTPVFTFRANDGAYNIEAGREEFYMFSDYEIDDMAIHSFVGRLSKLPDCLTNCNESLTIEIRDFQSVETGSEVVIVSSVSVGEYDYLANQDFIGFSDVVIEYTDEEGLTFRTDLVDQFSENTFQVLSVTDYNLNENNQPTKQIEIAFNCLLRNEGTGQTISFDNAEATIAVAYPE